MTINKKSIIGMIHVPALPGTPGNRFTMDRICDISLQEARMYMTEGVDGLIIENMNDVPFLNSRVGPEIIAAMAVIGAEIKKEAPKIPVGIQILAAANQEALAVAKAANLDFIRCEGFVFAHIADEGYIDGCAGPLLRYRKTIGAENIAVFTDVKKKHCSHNITADLDVVDAAKTAEFFQSDGIIVTGHSTAMEPDIEEVKSIRKAVKLPLLLGSGITTANVERFFPYADAFIVGSYFKEDGHWKNKLSSERIKFFMDTINRLKLKKN